jgi:hypothetical protein
MKRKLLTFLVAAAMLSPQLAVSQDINFPKPSPTAKITQGFATSSIEINYSRPSVKNRTIFGDVVPFGEVWRTGANAATTITFGQDVTINDKLVAKGTYGLLTIPNQNEWTIIISKDVNVTSARAYKQENDVVRYAAKVQKTAAPVETFTIALNNLKDNSVHLEISWENTSVALPITANFEDELLAQINKTMSTDNRPYYNAASYLYSNNKDLAKALEWITIADQQSPDRYWIQLLKAKIEFANKKYNDAMTTAELAKANATKAGNAGYAKQMDELMAQIIASPDYKAPKKGKKS